MMPPLVHARRTSPRPWWSSEKARRSGCEIGAHQGSDVPESNTSAQPVLRRPHPPPGSDTGATPGHRTGSAPRPARQLPHLVASLRPQAHPAAAQPRSATKLAPPCASWPNCVGTGATTTKQAARRPADPTLSARLAAHPNPRPATKPRTARRVRATEAHRRGAPKARRQHLAANAK